MASAKGAARHGPARKQEETATAEPAEQHAGLRRDHVVVASIVYPVDQPPLPIPQARRPHASAPRLMSTMGGPGTSGHAIVHGVACIWCIPAAGDGWLHAQNQ